MKKCTIVFTGGGTAGHVIPNLVLIKKLEGIHNIIYIGSKTGIEKQIVTEKNIKYYGISCGKLRRYFSWQNFIDPFKMLKGIVEAYNILSKQKIDLVFSKGGFVAFPVVVAAALKRIPVILHESDMTPGLANKLSFPFVKTICLTFEDSLKYIKQKKHKNIQITGTPIRSELLEGNRARGLKYCGFNQKKPCILIMGGSSGSQIINKCIRNMLEDLSSYQIIHLCGKDKLDLNLKLENYYQQEYAKEELADFFAASDIIISRSGANSLCEILALAKPHVLIPLSTNQSRGDQIQNARIFEKKGISIVLKEEDLNKNSLLKAISLAETKKLKPYANNASEKIINLMQEMLAYECRCTV